MPAQPCANAALKIVAPNTIVCDPTVDQAKPENKAGNTRLNSLLREPLLYFLVLGTLLFPACEPQNHRDEAEPGSVAKYWRSA